VDQEVNAKQFYRLRYSTALRTLSLSIIICARWMWEGSICFSNL